MNSQLELQSYNPQQKSDEFRAYENSVLEATDDQIFQLLQHFPSSLSEFKSYWTWKDIIYKVNNILLENSGVFVDLSADDNSADNILNQKNAVLTCCDFLCKLFTVLKDKQYYHTHKVLTRMISSWEFDVANAAANALYMLSVQPLNADETSPSEAELKDSLEFAEEVFHSSFSVFDGLGLLSSDYDMIDFLKSIPVPPYGLCDDVIAVNIAVEEDSKMKQVTVPVPLSNDLQGPIFSPSSHTYPKLFAKLREYREDYRITSDQQLVTIFNVTRAVTALKSHAIYRFRLLMFRLKCFYILIHSRLILDSIQPYVASGCTFLKDLMLLSDVNCEASSELKQLDPAYHELSSISCSCISRMISIITRRKSVLYQCPGILSDIGLRPPTISGGRRDTDISGALSQEVSWITVISSGCSMCTQLIHNHVHSDRSFSSISTFENDWKLLGPHILNVFELFTISVQVSDSQSMTHIMPVILSFASIVKIALPSISRSFPDSYDKDCDEKIVILVQKCLGSIGLIMEKSSSRSQPSPISVLQDCDFFLTMEALIGIVDNAITTSPTFTMPLVLKDLIIQIFSFMARYLKINRRRLVNPADAGISLFHNSSTTSIITKIFNLPCRHNERLWDKIFILIKEAVDLDPSVHTTVINGPYLTRALQLANIDSLDPNVRCFEYLFSLGRLARVLCVSNEGISFVHSKQIFVLIISATLSSASVLPMSEGISAETLASISKIIVSAIRDFETLRESTLRHLENMLNSICNDADLIWASKVAIGELPGVNTERLQILQKLSNVCTFVESLYSESRRFSATTRDIFPEFILTALVKSFACTLPPSRQLFSQLGNRQPLQNTYYGHAGSAKALSSLLKFVASVNPQSLLTVLLKAADTCLLQISSIKRQLLGEMDERKVQYDRDITKKNPRRDSFDEAADVLVTGLLDRLPNKCVFDLDVFNSEFDNPKLIEHKLWNLFSQILHLDWILLMISFVMRPNQTFQVKTIEKDVLRRLFAFHRSSLMEVTRFSASKLKTISRSENLKSHHSPDSFANMDSTEDETYIPRVPSTYLLRVVSSIGALLREDCEIEGSRAITLVENGFVCRAYERNQTSNGVIRYRTAHGWMSEYRKDYQSEILELLEVSGISHNVDKPSLEESSEEKSLRRLKEMMTIRECGCHIFSKLNMSMRVVVTNMAHCVVNVQPRISRSNRPSETLSDLASFISRVLSKSIKNYYSFAFGFGSSDKNSRLLSREQGATDSSLTIPTLEKKINVSQQIVNNDDSGNFSSDANIAALCMYYEAVSKYILIPSLHDRNGNLNTHLLSYIQICGGLEFILDGVIFTISAYDSLSEVMSPASQGAARALPALLAVIRKLVQPKAIVQSPLTASLIQHPIVEKHNNQAYDLIGYFYGTIAAKLLPVLRDRSISQYPPDIQLEWYTCICDLRKDLEEKLPPPEGASGPFSKISSSASFSRRDPSESSSTFARITRNMLFPGAATPSNPTQDSLPDPAASAINSMVDMGFERSQAIRAYEVTGSTNIDTLMDFLVRRSESLGGHNGDFDSLRRLIPEANDEDLAAAFADPDILFALRMSTEIETDGHQEVTATVSDLVEAETVQLNTQSTDLPGRATVSENDEQTISDIPLGQTLEAVATPYLRAYSPMPSLPMPRAPRPILKEIDDKFNSSTVRSQSGKSETKPSDYESKVLEMKALSNEISDELMELCIVDSCLNSYHITENFSESLAFVTQLFQILKRNETRIFPSLFNLLLKTVREHIGNDSNIKKNSLYGALNMTLCFLRNHSVRQQLNPIEDIVGYFNTLTTALSCSLELQVSQWSSWISSALVICYDLLTSVIASENVQYQDSIPLRDVSELVEAEDSKVETTASEEKSNNSSPGGNYNHMLSNWIYRRIRRFDVIPRSEWKIMFQIVQRMILKITETEEESLNRGGKESSCYSEIIQSLLLVLSVLVTDNDIRQIFTESAIFLQILKIPVYFASKDNKPLLSLVVQSALLTKEVIVSEVKSALTLLLRETRESESKKVTFGKFIEDIRDISYIKTNPKEVFEVILSDCQFYKPPTTDNTTPKGILVRLKPKNDIIEENQPIEDISQYSILLNLISHCCKYSEMSSSLFTASDVVIVLSNMLLVYPGDVISNVMAKLVAMDVSRILNPDSSRSILLSSSGRAKSRANFIDFLINSFFSVESETKSSTQTPVNDIFGCCKRFLIVLCLRKSHLRRICLNTLVRSLKLFSRPSKDENSRLRTLTRLCLLLPIILKSEKSDADNSTVDTVLQLISAGISDVLTEALAFIPLRNPLSSQAINAILEPLEIISRPQYQRIIKDHIKMRSVGTSVVVNDGNYLKDEETDSAYDVYHETTRSSSTLNDQVSFVAGTNQSSQSVVAATDRFESFLSQIMSDVIIANQNRELDTHDVDRDEPDDEMQLREGNHGVEGEERRINEDEDDEVEEEEVDDEQDDDDDDDDDNMNGGNHGNPEDMMIIENRDDDDDVDERFDDLIDGSDFLRSRDGLYDAMGIFRELEELSSRLEAPRVRSDYVTPPDRIRSDPLQLLVDRVTNERIAASSETMIRRSAQGSHPYYLSTMEPDLPSRSDLRNQNIFDSWFNGAGINPSDNVNRPTITPFLHPLLAGTDVPFSSNFGRNHQSSEPDNLMFQATRYPRVPIERRTGMRPMSSVGVGTLGEFVSELNSLMLDGENFSSDENSYLQNLRGQSDNDQSSNAARRQIQATVRSSGDVAVIESLISGLTEAVSSLAIELPDVLVAESSESENLQSSEATELSPSNEQVQSISEVDSSAQAVSVTTTEPSRPSQSPFGHSDDGSVGVPSANSVSSVSEMTRTGGDIITVASVNESVGESMTESLATEARSFQETIGESLVTASIFTSDAIRHHADYDNGSMLSSIPTTESDEEDSNGEYSQNQLTETTIIHDDVAIEESGEHQNAPNDLLDVEDIVASIETVSIIENHENTQLSAEELIQDMNTVESDVNVASAVEEANIQVNSELACPPGYDREVFYSLPEAMQREIIEQYSQTNNQTRELIEAAGFDYETFSSLPESIRQEILEQARRDHPSVGASDPAAAAASSQNENVAFLQSLTPDLRAEILLTADSAFLDSLPINLQAEAQTHRDQAARRMQEREMSHRGERATREATEERDEDQFGEEDDLMQAHRVLPGRNRGPQAPNQLGNQISTLDGYLRVPNDDIDSLSLPLRLLAVVTKVLCSTSVKINFLLLDKLLLNLSKNAYTRDVCLRLLTSLLANDGKLFKETLKMLDISAAACDAVYNLLLRSSDAFLLNSSRGCSLRRNLIPANVSETPSDDVALKSAAVSTNSLDEMLLFSSDDDGGQSSSSTWTIPKHTLQSLIFLLGNLISSNASTVFDLLRPRVTRGGNVDTSADLHVQASGEDSRAMSDPKKIASSELGECEQNLSSNSLLEILVSILSSEELTRNLTDLSSLTNIIYKTTAPLDVVMKVKNKPAEELYKIMKDREESDKNRNLTAIRVPDVVLSSDSLKCLCDILLSDICSRKIFSDVTTVISRLTVREENRRVLVSLLVNVTEDLADQSTIKLKSLANSLRTIFMKLGITKNPGEIMSPRTPHLTASQYSSLNTIPAFELGGKQHDHLLRTIQTLVAISDKNRRELSDIFPLSTMNSLWIGLDEALGYLKHFVGKEEQDGSAEQSSSTSASATGELRASISSGDTSSSPVTASLIFILTKLLPAIQSLFLVVTHDLLYMSDDEDAKLSARRDTQTQPSNPSLTTGTGSIESQQSDSTIKTSVNIIIPQSQVLGGRHRQSIEYHRMNFSLYGDPQNSIASPDDLSIQRSRSLQRVYSSTSQTPSSRYHRLHSFVSSHKNLLNLLIKSQSGLLEKSLSAMIRVTQLRPFLSFENKRKFFLRQLQYSRRSGASYGTIHLRLNRTSVFEDAYDQLRSRSGDEWHSRLHIEFSGEQGIDAGGLTREFFNVIAKEIFDPNYALFKSAGDGATFQPNPSSNINPNHLSYFKFIGNVIGKSICDGQLMDAHFTRSFYKHLLGLSVDYQDIEATEPDYYKALKVILENSLEELMMDLTFSAESNIFGKTEIVDLIPNGRNIAVTEENKFEYVRLIAHHKMTASIKAQIESFLDGFYELIPPELICIFSPAELELLICGLPDVDVENLRVNTDYHGYRPNDEIITWFWEALNSFSRAEKAAFVQFVTGTSKVPLGGFANLQGMRGVQRCSIHKAYGDHNQLPTAHTCFNQLDLPVYTSPEELREKLLLAVKEGSEGFGFA